MIFTSLVYEPKFCSSVLVQMLSPVISTCACVGRGRVCLFLNTASITCHTSQTPEDTKKVFERCFIGSMYGFQVMHVSQGKNNLLHRGLPLDFYQFPLQFNTNL